MRPAAAPSPSPATSSTTGGSLSTGIDAYSGGGFKYGGGGPVSVTSASVTTTGLQSTGIHAVSGASKYDGGGNVTVVSGEVTPAATAPRAFTRVRAGANITAPAAMSR